MRMMPLLLRLKIARQMRHQQQKPRLSLPPNPKCRLIRLKPVVPPNWPNCARSRLSKKNAVHRKPKNMLIRKRAVRRLPSVAPPPPRKCRIRLVKPSNVAVKLPTKWHHAVLGHRAAILITAVNPAR